jgi:outer membrane protein TolC
MPDFTDDFSQRVANAERRRADMAMALLAVQEAGIQGNIVRGRLFPTVKSYVGYIDQFGFNPWYKEANWYAGINISLPLFEKSLYDDLGKERILQKKAEKRLQTLDNQISLDIRECPLRSQCRAKFFPPGKRSSWRRISASQR